MPRIYRINTSLSAVPDDRKIRRLIFTSSSSRKRLRKALLPSLTRLQHPPTGDARLFQISHPILKAIVEERSALEWRFASPRISRYETHNPFYLSRNKSRFTRVYIRRHPRDDLKGVHPPGKINAIPVCTGPSGRSINSADAFTWQHSRCVVQM